VDVVRHHNNETIITTCDICQQDNVQENDTTADILEQIIDSGILDWDPQESWTANDTIYDGVPHIVNRVEERSTAINGSITNDREQRNQPHRPRGRPPKKGIMRRQYLDSSMLCQCK
jgi:hypothetical protein